ncbi:MAG: hypothetical protein KC917_16275, partial [Candidatus Omnitrophica bacterium]|nr:hypothetical protein [Candidatus Omnitrophota bacterium]
PQITLDRGTAFERRRYDEAENLVRRIERAQAGNEAVRMILDEESCHFDRLSGNHLGIVERLNPWIQRYPLSKYDTLTDEEILFAVRWVYATYLAAMATAGRYAEAEVGIEEFLNRVPFEDSPGMVVDMNFWLAWTLHRQGRYDEAVVQYEIGLQLDGSDSPDIVLPDYFTKTGIPKGLTTNRKTFVHYYRNALAALGGWEAGR